jgi:hypothetical protein
MTLKELQRVPVLARTIWSVHPENNCGRDDTWHATRAVCPARSVHTKGNDCHLSALCVDRRQLKNNSRDSTNLHRWANGGTGRWYEMSLYSLELVAEAEYKSKTTGEEKWSWIPISLVQRLSRLDFISWSLFRNTKSIIYWKWTVLWFWGTNNFSRRMLRQKIVMNLGQDLSRYSNNVMNDNRSNRLIFENEQRPGSSWSKDENRQYWNVNTHKNGAKGFHLSHRPLTRLGNTTSIYEWID